MEIMVDGTRYVPEGDAATPRIGVGITTHNRPEIFPPTYKEILRLTPEARVVVVDDASTKPVPEADYRFSKNAGIARAKNKCLELLDDCEHIFLFDDDVYPLVHDWWRPYVDSPEPHLMWVYDKPKGASKRQVEVLYQDAQHVAYHATRGCMVYVHRSVLDTVGGMDPRFGTWGWEHASWSDRIHSAGLTTWRYADVRDSQGLFYSMDQHREVSSTASDEALRYSKGPGLELRMESRNSPAYIEYREMRNVVLTTLLTGTKDPQRNQRRKSDVSSLSEWHRSLISGDPVVLHDELSKPSLSGTEFVTVENQINPYFQRHVNAFHYLRDHPNIGYVWCTDGTDVTMNRDPFPEMEPGTLYLGSEPSTLRNEWMLKNHPDSEIQEFFASNPNLQLLNAGLIGGDRETVMSFLHGLIKMYFDDHIDFIFGWEHGRVGVGDMGALNVVARKQFGDRLSFGSHVNSVFKAYEKTNPYSWWVHK